MRTAMAAQLRPAGGLRLRSAAAPLPRRRGRVALRAATSATRTELKDGWVVRTTLPGGDDVFAVAIRRQAAKKRLEETPSAADDDAATAREYTSDDLRNDRAAQGKGTAVCLVRMLLAERSCADARNRMLIACAPTLSVQPQPAGAFSWKGLSLAKGPTALAALPALEDQRAALRHRSAGMRSRPAQQADDEQVEEKEQEDSAEKDDGDHENEKDDDDKEEKDDMDGLDVSALQASARETVWRLRDFEVQPSLAAICGLEPPSSSDLPAALADMFAEPVQRKPRGFGSGAAKTAPPSAATEWSANPAAKQQWLDVFLPACDALFAHSLLFQEHRLAAQYRPAHHFILPAALAADADILEATLRHMANLVDGGDRGVLPLFARVEAARKMQKRAARLQLPRAPPADIRARFGGLMNRLRARLMVTGSRDALRRLARFEQVTPGRSAGPMARWSSSRATLAITPDELVILLLPLSESDAAWAASIGSVLTAAERGGAQGVIVHAFGVPDGAAADGCAAEQRVEEAVTRAAGERAASAAFAAAMAASSSADADGGALDAALAQLAALGEPSAPEEEASLRARSATLRLLSAAVALERGESDADATQAARAAALALLPPAATASGDVAFALQRLDAALTICAATELLRAAAAEAAAAEAQAMPLAARRDAVPRWEAALAAAGNAGGAAADALAAVLERVDDAAALSELLLASAAADAAPAALAALRSALDTAAAAPLSVTSALASELRTASQCAARWAALVELAAAHASKDVTRFTAAMNAATAAGADAVAIAGIIMPTAAAAPPPPSTLSTDAAAAAAAAPGPVAALMREEPGEWLCAGERIWYNRSMQLGEGSRGSTVFCGMYVDERGRSVARAAVKRLWRGAGEKGIASLELAKREVALLSDELQKERIASLHGYWADADWIYLAYERCKCSLAQALAAAPGGLLQPPASRLTLLAGVAAALTDVHDAGYAHNDVHGGNILLTADDGVKLTDVQLAVRASGADQRFSMTTFRDLDVQLNMARRAPEVLALAAGPQANAKKLTPAVDIWALGALAFQLLTGKASAFAPPVTRRKQGGGAAVAGRRSALALTADATENNNILLGKADLSALDAGVLSKRAALEARHLLTACLAVKPSDRPSIAEFREHPLLWDELTAAAALRALNERQPDEKSLRLALEAAGMAETYARLSDWRSAAHEPLLASHASSGASARYFPGFNQLLRFARNAHEHPPPPGTTLLPLTTVLPTDASTQACRDAVMRHFLATWPELALAVHICSADVRR